MRFKKLELFGFKSFAEKTTIHFESGVTAIIGPNGSGKSNIVDAIRWVLGEHNPRDIRAQKNEDVIFNGTDKRSPLNFAEVSLTISNEEGLLPISFTEVTVTRKVFRSGESEYSINKSPCRLRDIRELLMGTGLGSGSYAIIEQGHIDMVLSSKPDERRAVFEEASGIAKYLTKRKETQRKLNEVEEHLVRLNDIISEVRRQVKALERQANKARQYQTRWDRLKWLELRLAADSLRRDEVTSKTRDERLAKLRSEQAQQEEAKQALIASVDECNATVSAVQERVQALKTEQVETASGIQQHESQQALKSNWIHALEQQLEEIQSDEAQMRERLDEYTGQLNRFSGAEAEVQQQFAEVSQQLEERTQALARLDEERTALQQELDQAKAQMFEVASEATRQRNRVQDLMGQLQQSSTRHERLEGQRSEQAARTDDLKRRVRTRQTDLAAVQTQCAEFFRQVAVSRPAIGSAENRLQELKATFKEKRDTLAETRAQVKLLEDLWRHYEGFSETVKTLMESGIDGLIGPFIDLVVPEPGYEEVVESALGPLAEALVVENRQALARCRERMRSEAVDGARFLVLSDCPRLPETTFSPVYHESSVRNLLRVDERYQPLIDWVLNDSVVVEHLDLVLYQEHVPQARVVSRNGERWDRRSWNLSGRVAADASAEGAGLPAMTTHRMGRKKRWEAGKKQLIAFEDQVQQLEIEMVEAEALWKQQLQVFESRRNRLEHLNPLKDKLVAEVQQLEQQWGALQREQEGRRVEMQELAEQRASMQTQLSEAQTAVAAAEQSQREVEERLQDSQTRREAHEQQRQQVLVAKTQAEATASGVEERLNAMRQQRTEAETQQQSLTAQLDAKAKQRDEAGTKMETLRRELTHHESDKNDLEQRRAVLAQQLGEVERELNEAQAQRNTLMPQLLKVEQLLTELNQKIQTESRQEAESGFRKTRLAERLNDLYQIQEAELQAEFESQAELLEEAELDPLKTEIEDLRKKLEGLGSVSMGSVDEYDELKQRYEFLQSQYQDLTDARDELTQTITQINRTARKQFAETFEQVREAFRNYYTKLFNGGQADLVLLDENDVLESGVDIVARPPGKRLQNISLLSGGERALTATALVFALFKIKPSPFCILDEIDAPLDEANVDRFTRVLEEFLVLSQFIIITHNKKTITKADSLYGVTMQERGVSSILSARISEKEHGTADTPEIVAEDPVLAN